MEVACMIMRSSRLLLLGLLFAFALCGVALAEYRPEKDVYIYINSDSVDGVLPVEQLTSIAYEKLPTVYKRIENNTGKTVDYSYIWICGVQTCVPVDPFRVTR
jgi:hypothetical protein